MPWLKIDDNFPEHERIIGLPGPAAKWLHIVALCHCAKHLTDGHIEPFRLKVICAVAEVPRPQARIRELVDAGLWVDNEDGSFDVRDFLDYNPPASEVKAKREAAKARMRTLRSFDVRANKERTNGEVREKFADPSSSPQPSPSPNTEEQLATPPVEKWKRGLLDDERGLAAARLLERIHGGDDGTPRVVAGFCKQLPRDRIDRVASTLRVGVKPAIAVSALKREVKAYEAEVQAEGAA